MVLQI